MHISIYIYIYIYTYDIHTYVTLNTSYHIVFISTCFRYHLVFVLSFAVTSPYHIVHHTTLCSYLHISEVHCHITVPHGPSEIRRYADKLLTHYPEYRSTVYDECDDSSDVCKINKFLVPVR